MLIAGLRSIGRPAVGGPFMTLRFQGPAGVGALKTKLLFGLMIRASVSEAFVGRLLPGLHFVPIPHEADA